jgi:hypothetical protein
VALVHEDQRGACKGSQCGCQGFTCDHSRCGWKPREDRTEPSANDLCRCGHIRFRHQREDAEDTHCAQPSCRCTDFRARAEGPDVKTVELHDEPPMTPEEEEEAPPDERRCERCKGSAIDPEDSSPGTIYGNFPEPPALEPCRACQFPPPEGPGYEKCVCGHIVPEHSDALFRHCLECGCLRYRTEQGPPQPDRRPPYAVAYSVQGHLYEVALSGDATVRAVDGALVITHDLAPVAGIVQTRPMPQEGS